MRYPRITVDPARMNGLPCIRETRVTVTAARDALENGAVVTIARGHLRVRPSPMR